MNSLPFLYKIFKSLNFAYLLLIIFAITISGCSGDNKVKTSTTNVASVNGQAYSSLDMLTQINTLKSRYPCANNGPRIEKTFYYLINGTADSYVYINNTFSPGFGPNGTITKVYAGILPTINDLLIVRNISQGGKVVARNITISLCYYHPLIVEGRKLYLDMVTNLTLRDNSSCIINDVQGKFLARGDAYESYAPFFNMPEIFAYFPYGACSTY